MHHARACVPACLFISELAQGAALKGVEGGAFSPARLFVNYMRDAPPMPPPTHAHLLTSNL